MNTSSFRKNGKHQDAVSIAGRSPNWYKGKEYRKLSPKYWFFKKYKEDGDEEFYIEQYYKEVLNGLDPQEVYNDLTEYAIILC